MISNDGSKILWSLILMSLGVVIPLTVVVHAVSHVAVLFPQPEGPISAVTFRFGIARFRLKYSLFLLHQNEKSSLTLIRCFDLIGRVFGRLCQVLVFCLKSRLSGAGFFINSVMPSRAKMRLRSIFSRDFESEFCSQIHDQHEED